MYKEVEMTPENALQRLSAPFWAAFAGELVSVFGIDIFQPKEDIYGGAAIDYVTGTCGWHAALKAVCREVGDEWFYEWYDSLDWMKSDEFDCDLVAELIDRVVKRGEETRHAYYEWLVKEIREIYTSFYGEIYFKRRLIFMKNFKGEIVFRPTNATKDALMEIGEHIHQQLVGNMDYVNCNIGVHIGDDSVMVWFDDCEGEIPEIRI